MNKYGNRFSSVPRLVSYVSLEDRNEPPTLKFLVDSKLSDPFSV